MLSDKRRLLRDEEAKLHETERKIRDKEFQERTIAERLKHEYDDLRGRFEQMAFELRFSIEDELKIYARLLDELMKKSANTSSSSSAVTTQQGGSTGSTTYTTTSSTIRSGGIDEHDAPSTFQQTRNTSSSGAGGNVTFDLGSGSSTWPETGTSTYETSSANLGGGSGSLFRLGDNDRYDGSSVTHSSSYSNLN
jgi:hypothetical protein